MGDRDDPRKKPRLGAIQFFSERASYGELSNFYALRAPLCLWGIDFPTSEHAYQAAKYVYPGASSACGVYARVIAAASTPYKSKLLANRSCATRYAWQRALQAEMQKHAAAVADPAWIARRVSVMREVLFAKFRADAHCRDVLFSTAGRALEEASGTDRFWGTGGGGGENQLGRLLVEVRDHLMAEEPEK